MHITSCELGSISHTEMTLLTVHPVGEVTFRKRKTHLRGHEGNQCLSDVRVNKGSDYVCDISRNAEFALFLPTVTVLSLSWLSLLSLYISHRQEMSSHLHHDKKAVRIVGKM